MNRAEKLCFRMRRQCRQTISSEPESIGWALAPNVCRYFVLSTTTAPPFMTQRTLLMVTLTSASGSPSTATTSAKYPGARAPSSFSLPSSAAALVVAVARACSGVMPSLTNQPSSRVFWPHMVKSASEPIANLTPALNAR